MAIEALTDSSSKSQNDADAAGLCVVLVNAILTSMSGGSGHEVVHTYLWAIAAMCRGNNSVISSFARAGVPSAAVRTLASCSKMLAAEAALDVLSLYMHTQEAPAVASSAATISEPASATLDHIKLAAGALLTSDEAVTRLAVFARTASKYGRCGSLHTALAVMLATATVDFGTTASVLERACSKSSSNDRVSSASSSSGSALVQTCIASLMNDRCPHLCIDLLAKLVLISAFAREVIERGGISVLFARLYSNSSSSMLKGILSTLVLLASKHQQQFVSSLESMLWCEVSVAVEALLKMMKIMLENRKQHIMLADAIQLLHIFASLPTNFHFRMMSFMLSSQAIEIVLRCVINSHVCSAPELRGSIHTALEFVLTLMEFDLSIKPDRESKTSPRKPAAASAGGFVLDGGEYQSAASLVDVAPILPDLFNLFASCMNSATSAPHSGNQSTSQDIAAVPPSSIDSDIVQRAILRCIIRVLTFLVDNPLAADVTGAAGGVELLMKLFLFGEEEHKAAVLVVLRMLHAHNDMNRQIMARLIGLLATVEPYSISNSNFIVTGKLPHATKSLGKTLLKDHHPWLRSPPKPAATAPAPASNDQRTAAASSATCALPSVFKNHVSAAQSDAQSGVTHSETRKLRSQPMLHQLSRSSSAAPFPIPSAAPLPYLLAPLSKLFENYSSSQRMSAKHLRKLCHDFALKDTDSRVIMRCHADVSATCGDDQLSFTKFVEVLSGACSSLQLSLSQFLGEIGAKNSRAVSVVVDAARERSLAFRRLEQTKRDVFLQVDGWRDRQFMKRQTRHSPLATEQHAQYQQPVAQVLRADFLLKVRDAQNNVERDKDEWRPPRSQSVQLQKLQHQPLQQLQQRTSQVQRSRLSDEAALWAEFGCQFVK